jgi:hypothetical protein
VIDARLDGRDVPVTEDAARITLPESGGEYRIKVRPG